MTTAGAGTGDRTRSEAQTGRHRHHRRGTVEADFAIEKKGTNGMIYGGLRLYRLHLSPFCGSILLVHLLFSDYLQKLAIGN